MRKYGEKIVAFIMVVMMGMGVTGVQAEMEKVQNRELLQEDFLEDDWEEDDSEEDEYQWDADYDMGILNSVFRGYEWGYADGSNHLEYCETCSTDGDSDAGYDVGWYTGYTEGYSLGYSNGYYKIDKKDEKEVEAICYYYDKGSDYLPIIELEKSLINVEYKKNGKITNPIKRCIPSDMDIKYTSGNKNVVTVSSKTGQVTIKGIGTTYIYLKAGVFTVTYQINVIPAKASLTKVTAIGKNKMKVQWKKDSLSSVYQIQYSTRKDFKKDTKTVFITNRNIQSKQISGLKKGKKYYVRMRTKVNLGAENRYSYSAWSKVKWCKL